MTTSLKSWHIYASTNQFSNVLSILRHLKNDHPQQVIEGHHFPRILWAESLLRAKNLLRASLTTWIFLFYVRIKSECCCYDNSCQFFLPIPKKRYKNSQILYGVYTDKFLLSPWKDKKLFDIPPKMIMHAGGGGGGKPNPVNLKKSNI